MYLQTHRQTTTPTFRTDTLANRIDRHARSSGLTPALARDASLEAYDRRARALRAAAFRAVFGGLARALRAGLARLASGVRAVGRRSAARRELARLDDRLLADIGIGRGDIPAVVDGLLAAGEPDGTRERAGGALLRHAGAAARRIAVDPIRRWQRVRATRRALAALDDRLLRDIGITRGDIEAVARGTWRPRRAEVVALPRARRTTPSTDHRRDRREAA